MLLPDSYSQVLVLSTGVNSRLTNRYWQTWILYGGFSISFEIQGRLKISVNHVSATFATVHALTQGQRFPDCAALTAQFWTRKESIRRNKADVVPCAFIRHDSPKSPETLLLYRVRQMSIFHHARHAQILHAHKTWFSFCDCRCDLMGVIHADIRQPVMKTQEFLFLFGYIGSFTVFSFLLIFPVRTGDRTL